MKNGLISLFISSVFFINSAFGLGDPNQFLLGFKENMKTLLSSQVDKAQSDSVIESADRVIQGYTVEQKILFLNSLSSELDKAGKELDSKSGGNQFITNFLSAVPTVAILFFLTIEGKHKLLAAGGVVALASYYVVNKNFIDGRKELSQKVNNLKQAIDKQIRSLEMEIKAKSL